MKTALPTFLAVAICLTGTLVAQTISISQQPVDATNHPYATATFSVVATSSPLAQLSFQWFKNGTPIPNATNSSAIRTEYTLSGATTGVVLEAQDYSQNIPASGISWLPTTSPPYLLPTAADTNFSDTVCVYTPDNGQSFTFNPGDMPTTSPQLNYYAYFTGSGTYNVWVRGSGDSDGAGSSDSVNLGLDGVFDYRINGVFPQSAGFAWGDTATPAGAVLTVASPGFHVFNLWMREDGFAVDKVILTSDLSYTPSGVDAAESPLLAGSQASTYTTPLLNEGDVGTNLYTVRVTSGAQFVDSIPVSLVVTSTFVATTFYSTTVFNDQPLAYWSFDETNGSARQQMDVSQGATTANDLTPSGTATRVAHSTIGSGLFLGNAGSFDGGGNFGTSAPDLSSLTSLPGPYAVEVWLQLQGVSGSTEVPLGFDNSGAQSFYYNSSPYANDLEFYANSGRTGYDSLTINTNDVAWHHVVYVFYGPLRPADLLDGYLDGVLTSNICCYIQPLSLTGPITVGSYHPSGGAGWIGRIDELAIYNWASYTNLSATLLQQKATAMVNDHLRAATVAATGVAIDITQQPAPVTGTVGQTATFTVAATISGAGTTTYQWQKNWLNIPGATNASYTTAALAVADSGSIYRVQVSSGSVFVDSQEAALAVAGLNITISQQPTNATGVVGGTATFSVVASSSPPTPLNYQWKENNASIPGATNASYTTLVIQPDDSGTNFFFAQVSAGAASTNSATVSLTVPIPLPPQTLYSQVVSNDMPILYWDFDETSGNAIQQMSVPASPTTENDLVTAGTATRVSHALIGSGLRLGYCGQFDGNGDFNAPAPDAGQAGLFGAYAVELWVQVQGSGSVNVPLGFNDSGASALYYNNVPNALELYANSGRSGADSIIIPTTDTNWHYVVYVFYGSLRSSGLLDGYLDGVLTAPNNPNYTQFLTLLGPITVGSYRPAGGAGWIGRLDEVAIYDFSSFSDEASLTSYVQSMILRHRNTAMPGLTTLSSAVSGNQLTLSWEGAGMVLQETSSLKSPAVWVNVPNGGVSPVTVTIGSGNQYFRLSAP